MNIDTARPTHIIWVQVGLLCIVGHTLTHTILIIVNDLCLVIVDWT